MGAKGISRYWRQGLVTELIEGYDGSSGDAFTNTRAWLARPERSLC